MGAQGFKIVGLCGEAVGHPTGAEPKHFGSTAVVTSRPFDLRGDW